MWLVPALLAPILYTATNYIDKYLISNKVTRYSAMPIFGGIAGAFFGTLIWLANGMPILSLSDTLIMLLVGALTIWAGALYFIALSEENPSRMILFFQLIPVFVLILAYFFLHERISFLQLTGFFLILTATISLSSSKDALSFKPSRAFLFILLADLLWAIASLLIKFTVSVSSFSKIIAFESFGVALGALVLWLSFPSIRSAFRYTLNTLNHRTLSFVILNEGVWIAGRAITYFALTLGPASLVTVVGGIQVFYGILFGLLLSIFLPRFTQGPIRSKELLKEIIAGIVIFLGIYFLTL